MSLESLCDETATLERLTTGPSAGGGFEDVFEAAGDPFPCTIQPANGKLVERFARRTLQITHVLYTPTEVHVNSGDRVTSTNAETSVQRFFQVKSGGDQGDRGRVFAIHLLEIDPS